MRENPADKRSTPLDGTRTAENLRRAFAAEASLHFRYLYCAGLAEFEGRDAAAALFRRLAEGGVTAAQGCFDFLRLAADAESGLSVGGTDRNLELLLLHEAALAERTYVGMAEEARKEGFHDVASWFETLEKLKRSRARRLRRSARG